MWEWHFPWGGFDFGPYLVDGQQGGVRIGLVLVTILDRGKGYIPTWPWVPHPTKLFSNHAVDKSRRFL